MSRRPELALLCFAAAAPTPLVQSYLFSSGISSLRTRLRRYFPDWLVASSCHNWPRVAGSAQSPFFRIPMSGRAQNARTLTWPPQILRRPLSLVDRTRTVRTRSVKATTTSD
jgi:hypothetical protein